MRAFTPAGGAKIAPETQLELCGRDPGRDPAALCMEEECGRALLVTPPTKVAVFVIVSADGALFVIPPEIAAGAALFVIPPAAALFVMPPPAANPLFVIPPAAAADPDDALFVTPTPGLGARLAAPLFVIGGAPTAGGAVTPGAAPLLVTTGCPLIRICGTTVGAVPALFVITGIADAGLGLGARTSGGFVPALFRIGGATTAGFCPVIPPWPCAGLSLIPAAAAVFITPPGPLPGADAPRGALTAPGAAVPELTPTPSGALAFDIGDVAGGPITPGPRIPALFVIPPPMTPERLAFGFALFVIPPELAPASPALELAEEPALLLPALGFPGVLVLFLIPRTDGAEIIGPTIAPGAGPIPSAPTLPGGACIGACIPA